MTKAISDAKSNVIILDLIPVLIITSNSAVICYNLLIFAVICYNLLKSKPAFCLFIVSLYKYTFRRYIYGSIILHKITLLQGFSFVNLPCDGFAINRFRFM